MKAKARDREIVFKHLDGQASQRETELLKTRMREDREVVQAVKRGRVVVDALERLPIHKAPRDLVAAAQRQLRAAKPAPRKLDWLLFPAGAVAGALVALLWVLYAPPSDGLPHVSPAPMHFIATAVTGDVWVEEQGFRRQLAIGDLLQVGNRVETTAEASVTLSLDERVILTLDEDSRVGVVHLDPLLRSISMERGVVTAATPAGDAGILEMRLRGSLRWIELREGSLGILSDGNGAMTVACDSGEAAVFGTDQMTVLTAGYELYADRENVHEPTPIRPDLELDLEPVGALAAHVRSLLVAGQTNPGAEVVINGARVAVDAQGNFSHTTSFLPEDKSVLVQARDALRRRKITTLALVRQRVEPAPAPPETINPLEMEWDWTDKSKEPG